MGNSNIVRIGDIAEVFDGPHATPKKIDVGVNDDGGNDKQSKQAQSQIQAWRMGNLIFPSQRILVMNNLKSGLEELRLAKAMFCFLMRPD